MTDPIQLTVRVTANGATAQIRSIVDVADREEARRISAELKRMAAILDKKHGFTGTHSKRPIGVELA